MEAAGRGSLPVSATARCTVDPEVDGSGNAEINGASGPGPRGGETVDALDGTTGNDDAGDEIAGDETDPADEDPGAEGTGAEELGVEGTGAEELGVEAVRATVGTESEGCDPSRGDSGSGRAEGAGSETDRGVSYSDGVVVDACDVGDAGE